MKDIVIAAGYATRLGELTKNFPKPLLKIGENTILGRMLDDIDRIPEIDEHVIVTNHKFAPIFEEWVERHTVTEKSKWKKPITIVDDGTETNETRLGAVCDLLFAMDKLSIDDDLWSWRRIICCFSRFRNSLISLVPRIRAVSCAMSSRR